MVSERLISRGLTRASSTNQDGGSFTRVAFEEARWQGTEEWPKVVRVAAFAGGPWHLCGDFRRKFAWRHGEHQSSLWPLPAIHEIYPFWREL